MCGESNFTFIEICNQPLPHRCMVPIHCSAPSFTDYISMCPRNLGNVPNGIGWSWFAGMADSVTGPEMERDAAA